MTISGTLSLKRAPGGGTPAKPRLTANPAAPGPSAGHGPAGNPHPASQRSAKHVSCADTVNGRVIKVTIVLDTAEIAMLNAPDGQRRTTLRIKVGGRNVSADIATKSLRKAIATITEAGTDGCVAVVQGKLEHGDTVSEAGLVVQLKTAKVTSETP